VKSVILIATVLALSILAGLVQAKSIYVSDRLVITLRSGAGNQFKILKTLPAGTALEILQGVETDEWLKVKTPDDMEGYVQSQYLSNEPAHKDKLATAEKRLARIRQENADLKERLTTITQEKVELDKKWQGLATESEKMSKELTHVKEVSAKPMEIADENKNLKTQTMALENETEMLRQENQVLKDRASRDWFLAGGGVMVAGIFLGLLIPKIRWTKKSTWGDGF